MKKPLFFVAFATNYLFVQLQQHSDPAVVTMSEAQVPAQQQKNIFQVCMLTIISG